MSSLKEKYDIIFQRIGKDGSIKSPGLIQLKLLRAKRQAEGQGQETLETFFQQTIDQYSSYLTKNSSEGANAAPTSKAGQVNAPTSKAGQVNATPALPLVPVGGKPKTPTPDSEQATQPSVPPSTAAEVISKSPVPAPPISIKATEFEKVIPRATLGTGDCFYSSIYRAARERRLLERFTKCGALRIPIDTESNFIQAFRKVVAAEIRAGRLPYEVNEKTGEKVDAYESLKGAELIGNLSAVLYHYPTWFKNAFFIAKVDGEPEYALGSRAEFITKFANGAEKMTNWVGEQEVSIVQRLIKACGIKIIVRSIQMPEAPKKQNGYDLLHLWNQGDSHFVYLSFTGRPVVLKEVERELINCQAKCREISQRIEVIKGERKVGGARKTRRSKK